MYVGRSDSPAGSAILANNIRTSLHVAEGTSPRWLAVARVAGSDVIRHADAVVARVSGAMVANLAVGSTVAWRAVASVSGAVASSVVETEGETVGAGVLRCTTSSVLVPDVPFITCAHGR